MPATTTTVRTPSRAAARVLLAALLLGGAVLGATGWHPSPAGANRTVAEGTAMPAFH